MGSYIPAAPAEQQEMLEAIGLRDFRELYKDVPESMYLDRPLDIPAGMSELEVSRALQAMAAKTRYFPPFCGVLALMITTSPASSNTSPPRRNSSPLTRPIRRK